MTLLVHIDIKKIQDIVCSKNFLYKIYLLEDKNNIQKIENGYKFTRKYNHNDINKIENIPNNISQLIHSNLSNIEIRMETLHETLKSTDNCLIVKYSSILIEPDYINKILGNTKIILYVHFSKHKTDDDKCIVHFHKKIVNANEEDDDNMILDYNNNNVISNIFQENLLKIDSNILSLSEMFLGHDTLHNFILPTINNIFNTAFDAIQDIYIKRFIKYLSKKNIEVYRKK